MLMDPMEWTTLAEVKVQNVEREALTDKIRVEMLSVTNDENLCSVEEVNPSIEKATLTDPVTIEGPSVTADETVA